MGRRNNRGQPQGSFAEYNRSFQRQQYSNSETPERCVASGQWFTDGLGLIGERGLRGFRSITPDGNDLVVELFESLRSTEGSVDVVQINWTGDLPVPFFFSARAETTTRIRVRAIDVASNPVNISAHAGAFALAIRAWE